MGRPPNNVPCHSPTRPWVPPSHVAGSLLRGTYTPHSNKVRQFVLPIPPVPAATAKAIHESLVGTVQPYAAQQNRIRTLTSKVIDQRAKAAASQKRIVALEDEKEQGLRDIRETRQKETADIVAVVERKLRSRYNKETTAAHALWKEKLEEECEAKRKAWREEQQQEQLSTSLNEDEPDKKRTKLVGDDVKKGIEEKIDDTIVNTDNVTSSDTTIKSVTLVTDEPSMKTKDEETTKKKSDLLQEKLIESEAALEKLTETRAEMIWLLKQVIKADEKLNKTTTATATTTTTGTSSSTTMTQKR
jgi:hypothetical protein